MDARKNCVRCGGRLFLEFDYDAQCNELICISCGHLEPNNASKENRQNSSVYLNSNKRRNLGGLVQT